MPGRKREPSFQLASGTTNERDESYNLTTLGSIFYNTDTSNVEVYHEDPSNTLEWRDLVMNNKEQIDISGVNKITFSDGTQQSTYASPRPTAFSQSDARRELTVNGGNPTDPTNPGNHLGGAVTELTTSIVLPEANQNVFINCRVVGELNINSVDFGMIIHRSGGTGGSVFLRAAAFGDRGRFISPNVLSSNGQDTSTLDTLVVTYVDTTTSADTYIYTPVCVNSGDHSKDYQLNKVQYDNSTLNFEVAVSTMVLQVI